MKNIALAAALTLATSAAFAGSMSDPATSLTISPPPIDTVDTVATGSSSSGVVIGGILLALLALNAS